jgi:hypothetical protein
MSPSEKEEQMFGTMSERDTVGNFKKYMND